MLSRASCKVCKICADRTCRKWDGLIPLLGHLSMTGLSESLLALRAIDGARVWVAARRYLSRWRILALNGALTSQSSLKSVNIAKQFDPEVLGNRKRARLVLRASSRPLCTYA